MAALPRTLEPEVMDSLEEAIDYDGMDHREVNRVFVQDFLEAAALRGNKSGEIDDGQFAKILDVGTGTAQIPVEFCRRCDVCHVTAIDLSKSMLDIAARNIEAAHVQHRVQLERVDAKRLPFADAEYGAIISNSIVHHIPEPTDVFREMIRVLRPGGLLFVRDLLRPNDGETIDRLVSTYAGDCDAHQRQMFHDSLHAALTRAEVREILDSLGLPGEWANVTSDRHWTIVGRRSTKT